MLQGKAAGEPRGCVSSAKLPAPTEPAGSLAGGLAGSGIAGLPWLVSAPPSRKRDPRSKPRLGQDVCGLQRLDTSSLGPAPPLTLMSSNRAHPGQAAWEQLVSSLVCGCGHAMLFQNNRAWKLGAWDNTTPGRGILPREEQRD